MTPQWKYDDGYTMSMRLMVIFCFIISVMALSIVSPILLLMLDSVLISNDYRHLAVGSQTDYYLCIVALIH